MIPHILRIGSQVDFGIQMPGHPRPSGQEHLVATRICLRPPDTVPGTDQTQPGACIGSHVLLDTPLKVIPLARNVAQCTLATHGCQVVTMHLACSLTSCASLDATSTTPRNTSHIPPGPVLGKRSRIAYSLMRSCCRSEPSNNKAMNNALCRVYDTPSCMAPCIATMAFSTIHQREA